MNYDVILCTKDRTDEVLRFSRSLKDQSVHPRNFIVVDASLHENTTHQDLVELFSDSPVAIIFLTSAPGLTRQRNLGCRHIHQDSPVVFFFDDDVVLQDRTYIEKILSVYRKDAIREIGCVFGRIFADQDSMNRQASHAESRIFKNFPQIFLGLLGRLFLTASSKVYHVTPSGMAVSNQHKTDHPCFTRWQPGCCMGFRKEIFSRYAFDESLTGYSMREDLDMSYRVSKEYKILYWPEAFLIHQESPVERHDHSKFGYMDMVSWHWFVKKNMTGLNLVFFYWSAVGYILSLGLASVFFRNQAFFLRSVGVLKGLLHINKSNGS